MDKIKLRAAWRAIAIGINETAEKLGSPLSH